MINEESQKFYRKQLRRPVRRFLKRIFPLIIAASIVFAIMLTMFYFIPFTLTQTGGKIMVIGHTILAILLSVAVIWAGHSLVARRQSKFQPIRIRVRQNTPPFDNR